jgi:hypothetical protein
MHILIRALLTGSVEREIRQVPQYRVALPDDSIVPKIHGGCTMSWATFHVVLGSSLAGNIDLLKTKLAGVIHGDARDAVGADGHYVELRHGVFFLAAALLLLLVV